jgi:hypothetical protein
MKERVESKGGIGTWNLEAWVWVTYVRWMEGSNSITISGGV